MRSCIAKQHPERGAGSARTGTVTETGTAAGTGIQEVAKSQVWGPQISPDEHVPVQVLVHSCPEQVVVQRLIVLSQHGDSSPTVRSCCRLLGSVVSDKSTFTSI